MKKVIANYVALMLFMNLNAQSSAHVANHEIGVSMGSCWTPVATNGTFGMYLDLMWNPFKNFSSGFNMTMSQKKIAQNFSFSDEQPLMNFYEVGWLNKYDLVHKDELRISAVLNSGMAIARLGDNSIQEKYWTKYGYRYRAHEVASDYFFVMEPGVEISKRIFACDHYPDFYLTGIARYRLAAGHPEFGDVKDFCGPYFGLGISIIGFTNPPNEMLAN